MIIQKSRTIQRYISLCMNFMYMIVLLYGFNTMEQMIYQFNIGWGFVHTFGYPIKHPWIFKSYSFLSTPTCLGQYRLGPKHLVSFNKKVNHDHDFDHKHSKCKVEALKSVNDPNFDTCFRSKWRNYVALHCEHRYIVFKTKNVTHSVKLERDKMSTINIVHFAGEGMLY